MQHVHLKIYLQLLKIAYKKLYALMLHKNNFKNIQVDSTI